MVIVFCIPPYITTVPGKANSAMEIMGPFGQLQKGSKWVPLMGRIERLYRHAACRNISAGTSEIQRNTIATVGLKLPR